MCISNMQQQQTSILPKNQLLVLALDSPSASTKKSKTTKKTVTFSESVRVKKHLHRSDYSMSEREASWYTHADEKRIRNQIDLIIAGRDHDEETRGLESCTPQGARRRYRSKIAGWDAVLDLQDIQIEKGIYDEDHIAMVYYTATSACQIAATTMGSLDEEMAQETSIPALGAGVCRWSSASPTTKKSASSFESSNAMMSDRIRNRTICS